jgi:hypothetical protein
MIPKSYESDPAIIQKRFKKDPNKIQHILKHRYKMIKHDSTNIEQNKQMINNPPTFPEEQAPLCFY